jgi:hypothetical protein
VLREERSEPEKNDHEKIKLKIKRNNLLYIHIGVLGV